MSVTEDQLTPDERRRLEALAQAVVSSGAAAGRQITANDMISRAIRFDQFIREGR